MSDGKETNIRQTEKREKKKPVKIKGPDQKTRKGDRKRDFIRENR